MRPITLKYSGDCRKCGTTLPAGARAIYERRVGVFCPECEPTDPEEVREYRQEAADRKADRLEEWAGKRREKAHAVLNSHKEIKTDWAFITQPGRIPFRDRLNRQDDRAYESLQKAGEMQGRADRLRKVTVKGDRERRRQSIRDVIRPLLEVGMEVESPLMGKGTIKRINKKTVTLANCGKSGTFESKEDISWLKLPEEVLQKALALEKGGE